MRREIQQNEHAYALVWLTFRLVLMLRGSIFAFRRMALRLVRIFRTCRWLTLDLQLNFISEPKGLLPCVNAMARLLRRFLIRAEIEKQKRFGHANIL